MFIAVLFLYVIISLTDGDIMYVKIDKKKFEINELNTFWEKFKSLKFVLEPMQDYVILMKKKSLSTYMYCQRVDVVMTDEDDVVLKVYQQLPSERIILPKRKVKKTYLFPAGSTKDIKLGDKLEIKKK